MIKVAISGYFNPLTIGHIDYIKSAKSLGDYLIVIVNNDKQVDIKGSVPFMKQEERIKILESLRDIDEFFLSIDKDSSIASSLEIIKPDIFANGGDRCTNTQNNKEVDVCTAIGCKVLYGIGGKKVQSSSELIQGAAKWLITQWSTR